MRTTIAISSLLLLMGCANSMQEHVWTGHAQFDAPPLPRAPASPIAAKPDTPIRPNARALTASQALPPANALEARKVIYEGRFVLVVKDLPQAQDRLKAMAAEMGGYQQSLSTNEMVIRVPWKRFDEAADALARVGTVAQRDIKAQDVTEDYIDLQTRLRNSKALKEKVLGLLERAGTLQAALELEKEAARVTLDIERLESTISRLDTQVAFATLAISFRSPTVYVPPQINPQLPFDWLRGVGLDGLMQFRGKNLY